MAVLSRKQIVRNALFCSAREIGLLDFLERRMALGITILTYHRVLPDEQCRDYPLPSLAIPESVFRKQVAWLKERFCIVPVRDALAQAGPQRPVLCLTFDDGYLDNFEVAAPILDDAGIKGSFFITAGLIGTQQLLWFDRAMLCWSRLPQRTIRQVIAGCDVKLEPWPQSLHGWVSALKRLAPGHRLAIIDGLFELMSGHADSSEFLLMSVEHVRHLHSEGHEIGSHTMTHPLLPQLSDDALRQELVDSKRLIEEWIGQSVDGLCYPNGDHDERIVVAAKSAGYRYGCTTLGGLNRGIKEAMKLRRIGINPGRVMNGAPGFDELLFRSELAVRQGR